jgi:uncharacterized protein with HEPN domain
MKKTHENVPEWPEWPELEKEIAEALKEPFPELPWPEVPDEVEKEIAEALKEPFPELPWPELPDEWPELELPN